MTEEKKTNEKNIFTPERTAKYFFVSLIGTSIVALIIWPLLDMLFAQIDKTTFTYSVTSHIIAPIIFAIAINVLEFIFWNFFHKKNR